MRGSTPDGSPSGRRNEERCQRVDPRMNAVQRSTVVNAPIGSVYRQWLRLEDLPKFIAAVKEVKKLDANHFFIAVSNKAKRYEGTLEIMLQIPERRLTWRVVVRSSSRHFATGVVSFTSRSDRSTGVALRMSSSFHGVVSRRVDAYLRNFKRLIEKTIQSATAI